MINIYFLVYHYRNKLNLYHLLIPITLLTNLCTAKKYINLVALLCILVHQIYTKSYVVDKFIPTSICCMLVVNFKISYLLFPFVLFLIIIHDLLLYQNVLKNRIKNEYYNVNTYLCEESIFILDDNNDYDCNE